jgi:hypothetical protein
MKKIFLPLLVTLALVETMVAQTASFDIATFVPPRGWSQTINNGVLLLQHRRTFQGRAQFCQIYLFPSQPSNADATTNFQAEWDARVARPLGLTGRPQAQPETSADGWTSLTAYVDALSQGAPIRVILLTATGFGRFASVVVSVSPNSYQPELVSFFQNLNFHAGSGRPSVSGPSAPAANPGVGAVVEGSLANYVFTAPAGWSRQDAADRIVLVSPVFSNGEACQINMLPFRQASGSVADVALGAFRDIFRADPLSTYPIPSGIMAKGSSPDGWEYFTLKKLVGGQEGEARTTAAIILAAKVDGQIAMIVATSKDFMVSNCFGLLNADVWPGFFYSLQFKNAKPSGAETAAIKQRLAGDWTMATGTMGMYYTFEPNGRYADAMATQFRRPISNSQDQQTTTGFFGNGSYSFDNHTLTLQRDDHKRFVYSFRLEQVSRDSGNTWKDELVFMEPGSTGEFTLRRDR